MTSRRICCRSNETIRKLRGMVVVLSEGTSHDGSRGVAVGVLASRLL
jgi:hypothetical protein